MDDSSSLYLKQKARQLGFDLCRIVPIGQAPHFEFYEAWLEQGCAGEMTYLQRNLKKRRDPWKLATAKQGPYRSMIVLAVDYHQVKLAPDTHSDPSRGVIAAYARGEDYHKRIRGQLHELDAFIAVQTGRNAPGKCLVDSGPVMERDWAQLSGIGFTGKNCCTIHPRLGSWLLLATVLVPKEIKPDISQPLESIQLEPERLIAGLPWEGDYGRWQIPANSAEDDNSARGTCGRCSRCLSACPTNAFVGPYYLDPRRCISYWTIEARGSIPRELRSQFGNHIFGCDICQEVCPWNRRRQVRQPGITVLAARAEQSAPLLLDGFIESDPYWLVDQAFAARFASTPILRPGRGSMLRNVCVALGNWGSPSTFPALAKALDDYDPQVRIHSAWAIGEVLRKNRGFHEAYSLLSARLLSENHAAVSEEIRQVIASTP